MPVSETNAMGDGHGAVVFANPVNVDQLKRIAAFASDLDDRQAGSDSSPVRPITPEKAVPVLYSFNAIRWSPSDAGVQQSSSGALEVRVSRAGTSGPVSGVYWMETATR